MVHYRCVAREHQDHPILGFLPAIRAPEAPLLQHQQTPKLGRIDRMTASAPLSPRQEYTLSLAELVRVPKRRWKAIVGVTVLTVGVSGIVTLLLAPRYSASARVLVEAPSLGTSILGQLENLPLGLGGLLSASPKTAAEREVVRSRPVLASVVGPTGTSEISPDTGLNLAVLVDDLDRQQLWRAAWPPKRTGAI